eukprot:3538869-Amphidinium_carterae.2
MLDSASRGQTAPLVGRARKSDSQSKCISVLTFFPSAGYSNAGTKTSLRLSIFDLAVKTYLFAQEDALLRQCLWATSRG